MLPTIYLPEAKATSPFTTPANSYPYGITAVPDAWGSFVALRDANEIEDVNVTQGNGPFYTGFKKPVDVAAIGKTIFVVNNGTNSIVVFNAGNTVSGSGTFDVKNDHLLVANITVGSGPDKIDISSQTNRAYVANRVGNSVTVIDTNTMSVVSTISGFSGPKALKISDNTNRLYVANSDSNTISIVDLSTNTIITNPSSITVGSSPISIDVNPTTNLVYVANNASNTISVINGTSLTVVNTIGPTDSGSHFTLSHPESIAVESCNNMTFVANRGGNNILEFNNTANHSWQSTFTDSSISAPHGVTVFDTAKMLFVSSLSPAAVTPISSIPSCGGPKILSITASAGSVADIFVKFDKNTDMEAPNGTRYKFGVVFSQTDVNNMFSFSSPIPGSYQGVWGSDSQTFDIQITSLNAGQTLTTLDNSLVNTLKISVKSGAPVKDFFGNGPSVSTSPVLQGSFNTTPGPNILFAFADGISAQNSFQYSQNEKIHISFSASTNQASVSTKAAVDNIFTFSQSIGAQYHGTWLSATELDIIIDDPGSPLANPVIGIEKITVNPQGNLLDSTGTSHVTGSTILQGTFRSSYRISQVFTSSASLSVTLPDDITTVLDTSSVNDGATITIAINNTVTPKGYTTIGATKDLSANFFTSSSSCTVGGQSVCVVSFTINSGQLSEKNLDINNIFILHDSSHDGSFNDKIKPDITNLGNGLYKVKGKIPSTSKFAVGGVVTVLAIAHGGSSSSSQAFSADRFLDLQTLSQNAKDSIQKEDPYTPIAPSNDPTVPYYPFSLDNSNYLIARYANTIQTVTKTVGEPVNLQLASPDKTISHVALYTNMEGLSKEIGDSDTYIVYDKGSPLQIVDPHGFFSDVKIKTTTENDIEKFSFSITFAKPMPKSNIFIREWDEAKYSSDTKIKDAIQVMESPKNTQTSKDVISDETTLQGVPSKSPDENIAQQPTTDDITNYIKEWAGYSPTSISDAQLLDHIGIKGDHIPSWFMHASKWLVNGDTSQQEFREAVKYLSSKGVIR